ncbi:Ferredoxin--NADP reductase [Rosistilla oblonga]|uniref:ferredoxin--NADP reductase n=1 Tax=Rosistilla oblonga TaxID=2527990 RepID=UPI0011880817|nr:ferredoxin--NADP reductase [Rosistilla oblonga]QDV12531.1 Ferredoxin--NADP reductase [Rosistilla oblonga]
MNKIVATPPTQAEIETLRRTTYNATLIQRIDIHEDLALFRIKPDTQTVPFQPGQYLTLGLGYWEPRVQPTQEELLEPKKLRKVVKRAYSISCPMLDGLEQLAPCSELDYYEFYVTLVRRADAPPALTPRLFHMQEGDRIFASPRIVGTYVLSGVQPDEDVVFFATGTGEAPHNAMSAELLSRGHRGRIVSATCVRLRRDLGYLAAQMRLSTKYTNYQYLHFTTREAENTNPGFPGFVGKQHLQQVVESGIFEAAAGMKLDPERTHVFLCGNPAMIGYQPPGAPPLSSPGMLQVLKKRGFHDHGEDGPGQIRFEKYW